MRGKIGDLARVQHILESIQEIESATKDMTEDSFINNHVLRIAVVKWLEIIGEASNHLSEDIKGKATDIDWKKIIGMRHFVVHEYFGISYDTIWKTVTNYIPILSTQIEKILKEIE